VPWALQEYQYIQCIVNAMDTVQIFSLKENLKILDISDIPTLANLTYDILKSHHNDCTASNNQLLNFMVTVIKERG
jgi:hypothetical protein